MKLQAPFFSLYSPEELYYRRGFARFLQPDRRTQLRGLGACAVEVSYVEKA